MIFPKFAFSELLFPTILNSIWLFASQWFKMAHQGFASRYRTRQRNINKRRSNGLCRYCSKKAEKGKTCCAYHLEKYRIIMRERRQSAKSQTKLPNGSFPTESLICVKEENQKWFSQNSLRELSLTLILSLISFRPLQVRRNKQDGK